MGQEKSFPGSSEAGEVGNRMAILRGLPGAWRDARAKPLFWS